MEEIITKESPLPKYYQLKQIIRAQIKRNHFPLGSRFPSEREWMSQYKVSRATVRQALGELEREGILLREQGKGTFLASPEVKSSVEKITKGIGVLVPCITFSLYPGIIRGVEDVCLENGYHLILGNYDVKPEKEKDYMKTLSEKGISGFVISASYNSSLNDYYHILKEKNIPFVFTDIGVNGIEADLVSTDNVKGAYLGTKSLISSGCKRIAFLCGHLSSSSSKERFSGYKKALEENSLSLPEELIKQGSFSEEFGYQSTRELLSKEKMDGFFIANEPITIGALKAFKERGYKIPDSIKVCSFDEPNLPAELNFPIILVKQPRYQIGRTAGRILLERIREREERIEKSPYRRVLLEPEIKEF